MSKPTHDSRLDPAATDDVYAAIMAAHDGLTDAQSHALNARLVLLMANALGDADEVATLCRTARVYAG
ncbi:DUF2783 domain-containing protein [Salipiger sp. IMCC34102]|uniref:DUF2783 domain-containing protein n=1 Tax=Salipiger sp. IMCC34102 TaxID=2510647 RepID=UPI00101C5333|nr:DUF2783 domain-containing protein [Salipiger sp. IMCC34102]RYH02656.1 DUF2783 domain-containing protein [Salipiger sp. IMCC34102]